MKIAAPYVNDSRWKDIPDEYLLPWGKNSTKEKLLDFCEVVSDKRINIFTQDEVKFDFTAIEEAKKVNPNIYVCLTPSQSNLINELKEKEISYYFNSSCLCYNYVILDTFISMGISDIYIADDLFYNLKEVKEFLSDKKIQTRIVLNRIPSTSLGKGYDIRGICISPRDMKFLEDLIDVAEFDCGKDVYNWNYFNALYKTFFEKQEWFGDLRSLNKDLQIFYPVYSTIPDTILWKIRCRRKCAIGNKCNHCEIILNLARDLYKEGITIKPKKNKVKKE